MAISTMIGAKIHRREDPRLVSGHGSFVDDLTRPGMLHMAVIRCPYPHALVGTVETSQARSAPGVLGVYTHADLSSVLSGSLPVTPGFLPADGIKTNPPRSWIVEHEACYEGEPVAVLVAESRYQAIDAAQLVQVDYKPLAPVIDLEAAIEPGSPRAHLDQPDNLAWDHVFMDDTAAAFEEAEVVVSQRILQQRVAPTSMEPRGVVAEYSPYDRDLTIWVSHQAPHFERAHLAGAMGLAESSVRVISQDVGGAFGAKIAPYAEDYLAAACSMLTSRPVKWIETRTEAMQNTTHGRGQIFDCEVAAKRDGTLLGIRVTQFLDLGAYIGANGTFQTCSGLMSPGAYTIKHLTARTVGVLTNRIPTDPYRGAGRPEATHLIERMVDLVAVELGMDPALIRSKNFATEFPYVTPVGFTYDSGNYQGALDKAMQLIDYQGWRRQQAEGRTKGRYLGVGICTYVEICGFGPSTPTAGATGGIGLVDTSHVRVHPGGSVSVYVGTHAHGQGHDTAFAQIVADSLGVPMDNVELHHGDTAVGTAFGYGTYGSRSLAVGGMAIQRACQTVLAKAKKVAAHMLEAADEDIEFDQGRFYVKGTPERHRTMVEVAGRAYGAALPEGLEHGLEAISYFDPSNWVWPFGAHISVAEVDPETGSVELLRYVGVDDCGNVINPMIVEGQIQGGVAQAISQALFEEVVYDPQSGQIRTGTMLDYLVPSSNEIPDFTLERTVTPSPSNDLGVKGVGEAGTIAGSACVINAVCDALAPLGIKHVDMPASPDRIWKMIQEVKPR